MKSTFFISACFVCCEVICQAILSCLDTYSSEDVLLDIVHFGVKYTISIAKQLHITLLEFGFNINFSGGPGQ